MAMGFAARDWTMPTLAHEPVNVYDIHLRHYEQMRPLIFAAPSVPRALCNGESAERSAAAEPE